MIWSYARSLNGAIKKNLISSLHELRASLIAEDGEDFQPLDDYIKVVEAADVVTPKHHFFQDCLKQAVVCRDADAVRLIVSEIQEELYSTSTKRAQRPDKYDFAKRALNNLSQETGLSIAFDTQWHADNQHLLQLTQQLMIDTQEEFSRAVHELLPEIYVFNHVGHADFDFAVLASAKFHGLIFVNREDITGPETLADILAHHSGITFASGWLATDPNLLGHPPGEAKAPKCHVPVEDAANLLLSAIGCAWQAMWARTRSLSDRTPRDMRTFHEYDSELSMKKYFFRMKALAQKYDLRTELWPIATVTENMMERSGISISAHFKK